ncbi:MAG: hypothetical protein M3Y50_09935 [Acidobacteriota bacterium]|nr:hypothetical protein [Acidobacteriota bacterium]
MIAIVAGFILVAYLLAPGAIYRLTFSFYISSKRFQRTRTEEVVFSVLVTVIPFFLAWILLLHTPLGASPAIHTAVGKREAYRQVLSSLLSDTAKASPTLIPAYLRSAAEQGRFVSVLWLLCALEGWLTGRVIRNYGDYPDGSFLRGFCDRFLLKNVSEWQVLFTTLALPSDDPRTTVEIDALSTLNILYRGRLVNWFTDQNGQLEGIFLIHAQRFRRDQLARDRDANIVKDSSSYWAPVPGSNLYLVANNLTSYNVRYLEPSELEFVEEELGERVFITRLPSDRDPDETQAQTPDATCR